MVVSAYPDLESVPRAPISSCCSSKRIYRVALFRSIMPICGWTLVGADGHEFRCPDFVVFG